MDRWPLLPRGGPGDGLQLDPDETRYTACTVDNYLYTPFDVCHLGLGLMCDTAHAHAHRLIDVLHHCQRSGIPVNVNVNVIFILSRYINYKKHVLESIPSETFEKLKGPMYLMYSIFCPSIPVPSTIYNCLYTFIRLLYCAILHFFIHPKNDLVVTDFESQPVHLLPFICSILPVTLGIGSVFRPVHRFPPSFTTA